MSENLNDIGNQVKEQLTAGTIINSENTTNVESAVEPYKDGFPQDNNDDGDDFIFMATPDDDVATQTPSNNTEKSIETKKQDFIMDLVMHQGYTMDAAKDAAEQRFNPTPVQNDSDDSDEESEVIEDTKSETVIVKVADKDSDKIHFTEEEKEKLTTAKVIKFQEVTDKSLKNVKISKYKKVDKINALKELDRSISRYCVPLPCLGEYATFRGAQTITLITNLTNNDDTLLEQLQKKAAILYDRFVGGATVFKTNEKGDVIMSFPEFCSKYKYNDINYGLFAVFVASSREDIETELGCPQCNKNFNTKYNIQSLLNINNISDTYKDKITSIIDNKTNTKVIGELVQDAESDTRYRSDASGNLYDITQPSISKAIRVFEKLDENDPVSVYNAQLLLYLDSVIIQTANGDNILYGIDGDIEKDFEQNPEDYPDYDPIEELFMIIQELTQYDKDMIASVINRKYQFDVEFQLKTKCPNCGKDLTNNLDIATMVFLTARGSSVAIES